MITGKGSVETNKNISIEEANKLFSTVQDPEDHYNTESKIVVAHKKTIEVLEKVVTELRNDKTFLKELIEKHFDKT